jgi:hypothetical protein
VVAQEKYQKMMERHCKQQAEQRIYTEAVLSGKQLLFRKLM